MRLRLVPQKTSFDFFKRAKLWLGISALMMVVGIALLMSLVGLSPALGTFLAGVVLANSEYRHELESDIDDNDVHGSRCHG